MSTYVYTARPERGSPLNGQVSGDSKAAVASELRRKGLTVLSMDEKKGLPNINELLEGTHRIKLRDKVVFSRQFATMINAGLALLRGLYILEEQTSNPRFRKIITAVRQDVEAGMPLSDAMEKHPVAFDRLYVSMVRAGEIGGVLDQTLDRLATQLEKDDSLRRSIKSAMTYPHPDRGVRHPGHVRADPVRHPHLRRHVQRPGRTAAASHARHDGDKQHDARLLVHHLPGHLPHWSTD